jgi:hypothetical protein
MNNTRTVGPVLENHYQFLKWLLPTLEKFPRNQKFLLGDRIQTQALEVLESLIDATFSKSKRRALQQANLNLEKIRYLIRLSYDMKYINDRKYEHAAHQINDIGKQIGGWNKYQNGKEI